MDRVAIDEGAASGESVARRALTEPLGTTALAVNHYRVPPREGLPAGLHAHADQEEVFVVLSGAARFETLRAVDGEWVAETVRVDAGEVIRFGPGEFQSGHTAGDDDLAVLAVGAPRDGDDVRLPVACPDCARGALRLDTDGGLSFSCPDCGADAVPAPCPDCGGEDLRVTLGDAGRPTDPPASETVVVCDDCATTFAAPPLAE